MKRIIFLIATLISIVSFSQDYNGKRVTASERLSPPTDTTHGKKGFAEKDSLPYWGNGVYWMPPLLYRPTSDEMPGDHIGVSADPKYWTNFHATASQCNNTGNINLSYISGLTYAYNSGPYSIACQQYNIAVGSNITLDDGDAGPGEFRTDAVILNSGGVTVRKGDNSVGGVGAFPDVDPAIEILLSYIRIDEDEVVPTGVSGTTVYYDNAPTGEFIHTTSNVTASFIYGVNPQSGDSSIRFTAASNNGYIFLTSPVPLSQNSFTNLSFWVRNNAVFNNNRNWVIRLYNGANQVSGSASITLTTQRGYNKTAAFVNQWQLISISLKDFGGQDAFNRIQIRNTGTGGTVNVQMDNIKLEQGIIINNPGNPPVVIPQTDFPTIAALRASTTYLDGTVYVSTLGYWAFGDGGGAFYYWSPGTTTADNGGTVIRPTSVPVGSAGRWLMAIISHTVNVKQFGAKGDAVTDDLPAFKAAVAALPRTLIALNQYTKGKLIVPQADSAYKWSDSLLIQDQITIEGQTGTTFPYGVIKIYVASGKRGIYFAHGALGGGASSCVMNNLSFLGLGSNTDTTRHGVESNGIISLDHINVENFGGNGIYLNTTVSGNVAGSSITYCGGQQNGLNGLSLDGGESTAISIIGCNFQYNGRWNYYNNGFLGIGLTDGQSAGGGARAGYPSDCIASRGGHYYIAHYANLNIEPTVTAGWDEYWQDLGTSYEIAASVSAWSSGTHYKGGGPRANVGAVQAGVEVNPYTEGGSGLGISGGSNLRLGGVNGGNFRRVGVSVSAIDGFFEAISGEGFRMRGEDTLKFAQLTKTFGLEIGKKVVADESQSWKIQMEADDDSTIHIFSKNVYNIPTMLFTGRNLKNVGFKTAQAQVAGLPIIGKFGQGYMSVNSSAAFSTTDDIGMFSMGSSFPADEGLQFRKGFVVMNTDMSANDTLFWVANTLTNGGASAAWDRILKSGGGGGGATAFTDLTDVPASYSGQSLKAVRVNSGETALEFYTPGGGGGTPAGSDTYIQYNTSTAFDANSDFTYDNATKKLTVSGWSVRNNGGSASRMTAVSGQYEYFTSGVTNDHYMYNGAGDNFVHISATSDGLIEALSGAMRTTGSFQVLGTSAHSFKWNAANGTPSNTVTPVGWLRVNVAGTESWIQYFQ